jgi:hypothetical protein
MEVRTMVTAQTAANGGWQYPAYAADGARWRRRFILLRSGFVTEP